MDDAHFSSSLSFTFTKQGDNTLQAFIITNSVGIFIFCLAGGRSTKVFPLPHFHKHEKMSRPSSTQASEAEPERGDPRAKCDLGDSARGGSNPTPKSRDRDLVAHLGFRRSDPDLLVTDLLPVPL